jgi:hypothetical protein
VPNCAQDFLPGLPSSPDALLPNASSVSSSLSLNCAPPELRGFHGYTSRQHIGEAGVAEQMRIRSRNFGVLEHFPQCSLIISYCALRFRFTGPEEMLTLLNSVQSVQDFFRQRAVYVCACLGGSEEQLAVLKWHRFAASRNLGYGARSSTSKGLKRGAVSGSSYSRAWRRPPRCVCTPTA